MSSRVAYLSHNDSISIYEGNHPEDFIVDFNDHIELNSASTVELIEFKCKLSQKSYANVYIFSDICENSILNATSQPILRAIKLSGAKNISTSFSNPIQLKTAIGVMKSCRIYITNKDTSRLSFRLLEAEVTLRFKNVTNPKI